MNSNLPTHAIVAVTLNCNSRCVMCDIWKNRVTNELQPEEYLKLPPSLIDINITGGEPFLRMDLPEIVFNIKKACPRSRLILNTNGFLPQVIKKLIPRILEIDKSFAVRVSIDGWEETHDKIRRIPNGFSLARQSLRILKDSGIKDLGICFTIMKDNLHDLPRIHKFSKTEGLQLALTMAVSSPIYFGLGKESLLPDNHRAVIKYFNQVIIERYKSIKPKEWFRGWFEEQLLKYYLTHRRSLGCDAGVGFFYLDSTGNVFTCNIKNWLLGNIRKNQFKEIWNSNTAVQLRVRTANCQDCWLICSAKSAMKSELIKIGSEVLWKKMRHLI